MPPPHDSPPTRRALLRWCAAMVLGTVVQWAHADGIELNQFVTRHTEDGLQLNFSVNFDLPHSVEDALHNNLVPIYFTADVALLRHRWYWRDARVANVSRTWRLAWQPLTRQYKVSTGGLNQSFANLADAMALIRGQADWRIAEAKDLEDGGGYYVEFSYRLDTSQLPRPMQIGFGATQGWGLSIERSYTLNADFSVHGPTP